MCVGAFVGLSDGVCVGAADGTSVVVGGSVVGWLLGVLVGALLGRLVGTAVGLNVGFAVGFAVGLAVGFAVGFAVGLAVGLAVGFAVGLTGGTNLAISCLVTLTIILSMITPGLCVEAQSHTAALRLPELAEPPLMFITHHVRPMHDGPTSLPNEPTRKICTRVPVMSCTTARLDTSIPSVHTLRCRTKYMYVPFSHRRTVIACGQLPLQCVDSKNASPRGDLHLGVSAETVHFEGVCRYDWALSPACAQVRRMRTWPGLSVLESARSMKVTPTPCWRNVRWVGA